MFELFKTPFSGMKREDWPQALSLSAFFFLVIATYWVVKPIKRGLIISFFEAAPIRVAGLTLTGAEAEQLGKVLNVVAVSLVVMLFTWLVRRVPRHHLVLVFASLFAAVFAIAATLIDKPQAAFVWGFYVAGDMYNTAMVALFWAFTNDIASVQEARRTYALIGLGGVLGGFFGATIVSTAVESLGRAPLLLGCTIPMVGITLIGFAVHRREQADRGAPEGEIMAPARADAAHPVLSGARAVFSSRYLMALAAVVGIYELVSNVIDFQLSFSVERAIDDPLEKDAFFARVGQIIGLISIGVQLLLTGAVLERWGVRVALLFLPLALLATSMGFLLVPLLGFAAAMSVSDNSLSYSIHQSAKETLYVPLPSRVKHEAKAFIDMFTPRVTKVISAVMNLAAASLLVAGVRWLALVTVLLSLVWIWLVRYLIRVRPRASMRS